MKLIDLSRIHNPLRPGCTKQEATMGAVPSNNERSAAHRAAANGKMPNKLNLSNQSSDVFHLSEPPTPTHRKARRDAHFSLNREDRHITFQNIPDVRF